MKDDITRTLISNSILGWAGEDLQNDSQFILEALMRIFGRDNQLHSATEISQAIQPSQHDLMETMQEIVDNTQRPNQGVENIGEQPVSEER